MIAETSAEPFSESIRRSLTSRLKGAESRLLAAQRNPAGSRKWKNLLRRADTQLRRVLSTVESRKKGPQIPADLRAFLIATTNGVRADIATLRGI
jgi:hypothetical protein